MTRTLGVTAAGSLLLHAALVWVLLPHTPRNAVALPGMPPSVEVDFVEQTAAREGAPAPAPSPPSQQPRASQAEPPPEPAEAPVPPPAPPVPAARPSQFAPVNLSGGDEDRDPLLVTGPNVVPPQPDAAIHNRAPSYPPDAARRGSEGLVGLLIHVTEDGTPAWVEIRVSSGDRSLDNAAREAVSAWRFRPALAGGTPVPFDYPFNIRFTLGGSNRSVRYGGQDRPGYDPRR